MKTKNLIFPLLLTLFTLVNFSLPRTARPATFEVSITGTDTVQPIVAFNISLQVSSDFTFDTFTQGDAIPSSKIKLGWFVDTSPQRVGSGPKKDQPPYFFEFGISDWDYLMKHALDPNPLLDGTVFTFTYEGSILGVERVQFGNIAGENLYRDNNNPTGPMYYKAFLM